MPDEIGISGLTELKDALQRQLPEALQGKASQRALTKAARPIVKLAQDLAPNRKPRGFVGPARPGMNDTKPGLLKKAIYSFRNRASTRTYESRFIGVRAKAWWWRFIEFGRGTITSAKSLGTPAKGWFGKVVRAVPARPFLRPAFEAKKIEAIEIFRRELAPAIEKVAAASRSRTLRKLAQRITGF